MTYVARATGGDYIHSSNIDSFYDIFLAEEDEELWADTDDDGLADYYEKLVNTGKLRLGNGVPVKEFRTHKLLDYDEDGNELWSNENAVLLSWSNPDNQDSDGDGLMDGNELQVTTRFDGHTYIKMYSNPCLADSDGDELSDNIDVRPLVKFNPESYVFYDPYFWGSDQLFEKPRAWAIATVVGKDLEELYGTETHVIPVDTAEKFANEWNKMGQKGNDIGAVVVFVHGSADGFVFSKKLPRDENGEEVYNQIIATQGDKLINGREMDVIILLVCEAGRIGSGLLPTNMTSMITERTNSNYVIASDGTVGLAVPLPGVALRRIKTTANPDGFVSYNRVLNTSRSIGVIFEGIDTLISLGKF